MRFTDWKASQVRYDTEFGIIHTAPKDQSIDLDEIEENEFYARRINTKIYQQRAKKKEQFNRNIFMENFKKVFNTSEDIVGFRKKMTTVEQEEAQIQAEIERR